MGGTLRVFVERRLRRHSLTAGRTAGQDLPGAARRATKSRQSVSLPALFCLIIIIATACSTAPGVPTPTIAAPTVTATSAPAPANAAPPLAPALTSPLAPDSTPSADAPAAARSTETATPVYTYQIVHTFPHDRTAFTEGLFWDGGYLYESTGENGHSGVLKEDLTTGQVLQSTSIGAQYFGEGIAATGGRLYELTWQTHIGFLYDQATFKQLGSFTYPTEGWGLTYDGHSLIMSDGSNVLHFMDPATFTQTAQISVTDGGQPVTRLNELEYVKGQIYANVWQTDRIAVLSPQTGAVLAWIDCTGLRPPEAFANPDAVLNGIAYDPTGDRLFVTGKLWPNLYEIRLLAR